MVKLTAMASVIQYPDILRSAQTVYYANGLVIELLLVASAWYLAVVTLLSLGQMVLERRFARGQVRRQIAAAPGAALPKVEGAGA